MSMMDNILGMGRYGYVNESVEPELADCDLDYVDALDESVDPMDFILSAIYENQMNMVNIDMAIMCEEFAYLRENGEEMIYEANKLTTILDKCKSTIMSIWNKIQSFLKTAQEKLISKKDEAFLRKYEDDAKGNNGVINGYKNLFDTEYYVGEANDAFDELSEIADTITRYSTGDYILGKDKKADDFFKFIDDAINGKEGTKAGIKNMFKEINDNKKTRIVVSAEDAIKTFNEITENKNKIKTAYNESKDNINKQLKAVKTLENSLKKFKVIPTEASSHVHRCVRAINKVGSALAMVNRSYIRALSIAKSQAKAAIVSAATAGKVRQSYRQDEDEKKTASSRKDRDLPALSAADAEEISGYEYDRARQSSSRSGNNNRRGTSGRISQSNRPALPYYGLTAQNNSAFIEGVQII